TWRCRDDLPLDIVGPRPVKWPMRLIWTIVDQFVSRLRLSNTVVVELLVLVGVGHLVARRRLVVTRVEESLVVARPRAAREFPPFYDVGEVVTVVDVADVQLLPVGSAGGEAVGEVVPIVRGSRTR